MKPPPDPHYRHRFSAEIISYAVWLYHVFSLSLRDVELLLAERGIRRLLRDGATLVQEIRCEFRRPPAPPPAAARGQVAHGRSLHPDPGRAALSLARRRSEWRCARHPRSGPARCQRREALLQAASEGFAVRPAGDRDRQAAELWCRSASTASRRRAPTKPISEQSGRELASADATTRAADATVQIVRTSAGLPLRSFIHLRPLPSTSTSTCSPCPSRDPVGRFRNLAPGDMRPTRSMTGALDYPRLHAAHARLT